MMSQLKCSPRFSVCIPHYGNEKYLLEAVASVAAQSFDDWELIVSLDSDISGQTEEQLYQLVPDATLVLGPRRGIGANWNFCVRHAAGDFVVLLHSDDRLGPAYLESMQRKSQRCQADLYFCSAEIMDHKGKPVLSAVDWIKQRFFTPSEAEYVLEGDAGLAALLRGCFIFAPTICYRKNLLEQHYFGEQFQMVVDLDFYFRAIRAGAKFCGTAEVHYFYRRHAKNQTQKLTHENCRFREEIDIYKQIASTLAGEPVWSQSYRQAKARIAVRGHIAFYLISLLVSLRLRQFSRSLKLLRHV